MGIIFHYMQMGIAVTEYKPHIKLLHADSMQLSRFLLKEKAAKTAPTYSPVNAALALNRSRGAIEISYNC